MPIAFVALLPGIALVVAVIFTVCIVVTVAASRHKKTATGEIELIGTIAVVKEPLTPEGAVLARGELWRARLSRTARDERQSVLVKRGNRVRIVGASGHLLEVEPPV